MPLFQTLTRTPPYLLYMMDMEVRISLEQLVYIQNALGMCYYGETPWPRRNFEPFR